jgi:hypothetical protein
MNKHEATELGIRLVSILNLTTLISSIPAFLSFNDIASNTNSGLQYNLWVTLLFSIVTPLFISLLLWFKANAISRWLWRKDQIIEVEKEKSPTATQIQIVFFSSIGLYLLLSAMPDIFKVIVYLGQKMVGNPEFIGLSDYAIAVGYLIRMIISIWLIFNSDEIVRNLQHRQEHRVK